MQWFKWLNKIWYFSKETKSYIISMISPKYLLIIGMSVHLGLWKYRHIILKQLFSSL